MIKDCSPCSKGMMAVSVICVALAALGAAGTDIFLASTQWILMAILFAVYSLMCKRK